MAEENTERDEEGNLRYPRINIPWGQLIYPIANAAEDPEIIPPGHLITYTPPEHTIYEHPTTYYDESIDDKLEQKISQIIQQKLSDLLLSHVCPVCKKQLEE